MPWSASGNGSLVEVGFRFGFGALCGAASAVGMIALVSKLIRLVL